MALFFLALLSICSATLIKDQGVYIITTSNIEEFLSQKDSIRVIFFLLKGSYECQDFKPIFDQVAQELSSKQLPVIFGKIETSFGDNRILVERFKPKGSPHIIYFLQQSDTKQEYKKSKTSKSLSDFLTSRVYKMHSFTEVDQFDKFLENEAAVLGVALGIFESFQSRNYKYFQQVAYENAGKYNFAAVEDSDGVWGAKFDLDGEAVVAVRGPALLGEDDRWYVTLKTPQNAEEILEFLRKNRFSFMNFYSKETEEDLEAIKRPLVVMFLDIDGFDNAQVRYNTRRLRKTVDSYVTQWESEKKFTFAIGKMQDFGEKFKRKNLDTSKSFLVINPHNKDYYILPNSELIDTRNELNEKGIQTFLKDFHHDKLSYFIKSEEIPEYDYLDNVRVLVGKNIERVISKAKQDILLYIYVDFLEQPSEREAVNAIARKYRDSDELLVAHIDSNKNDIIKQYNKMSPPVIYYIRTEKKFSPISYSDSKISYEGLESFISLQKERKKDEL
jgi:hypothetical protein